MMRARRGSNTVPNPETTVSFTDPDGLLCFDTFVDIVEGMSEPAGGWSRLVDAIRQGHYDHLLNAGSPVPHQGRATPTLLWCCAAFAPAEVVEALLQRGADPRVWTGTPPVLESDKALPINVAAARGRADIVSLLLAHGADMDHGEAVAAAVASGDLETLEVFLRQGVDTSASLSDGRTLLQAAQEAEDQLGARGLVAAIRRSMPRRQRAGLELSQPLRPPTGISAFVEPRLSHPGKPSWALLAAECSFEELATIAVGRHERDIARRSVAGRHGIFLIRFRSSRWTWALLQFAGLEPLEDPLSLERVLDMIPHVRAVAVRGLSAMRQDAGSRQRYDLRSDQRARAARTQVLKRVDEFAFAQDLFLPNSEDVSDGETLVLRVAVADPAEVARLDVIVTND